MEKEQNRPGTQQPRAAEKITSPEQGREPDNAQQTIASQPAADISQVDQQEGDMKHGELGGNFDATDTAEEA